MEPTRRRADIVARAAPTVLRKTKKRRKTTPCVPAGRDAHRVGSRQSHDHVENDPHLQGDIFRFSDPDNDQDEKDEGGTPGQEAEPARTARPVALCESETGPAVSLDGTGVASGTYCFLCATTPAMQAAVPEPSSDPYMDIDRNTTNNQRIARHENYQTLLGMITDNIGRMDEDCLLSSVQCFYDSELRPYVEGTPAWSTRTIQEHIRRHEINPAWQSWSTASDIRTMLRINLANGVCTKTDEEGARPRLDAALVRLHIQLLRQLDIEVAKASRGPDT